MLVPSSLQLRLACPMLRHPGCILGRLRATWAPFWLILGVILGSCGASLGHLGVTLGPPGPPGATLGPSWLILGPSWATLRLSWSPRASSSSVLGQLSPILGQLDPPGGLSSSLLETFPAHVESTLGPSWDHLVAILRPTLAPSCDVFIQRSILPSLD